MLTTMYNTITMKNINITWTTWTIYNIVEADDIELNADFDTEHWRWLVQLIWWDHPGSEVIQQSDLVILTHHLVETSCNLVYQFSNYSSESEVQELSDPCSIFHLRWG